MGSLPSTNLWNGPIETLAYITVNVVYNCDRGTLTVLLVLV